MRDFERISRRRWRCVQLEEPRRQLPAGASGLSPMDSPLPPPASPHVHAAPTRPNLWQFLFRAIRLRCPECGVSPMFVPVARTRSLRDWFTPLDGCPRCGYAYDREDGYFLLA